MNQNLKERCENEYFHEFEARHDDLQKIYCGPERTQITDDKNVTLGVNTTGIGFDNDQILT